MLIVIRKTCNSLNSPAMNLTPKRGSKNEFICESDKKIKKYRKKLNSITNRPNVVVIHKFILCMNSFMKSYCNLNRKIFYCKICSCPPMASIPKDELS